MSSVFRPKKNYSSEIQTKKQTSSVFSPNTLSKMEKTISSHDNNEVGEYLESGGLEKELERSELMALQNVAAGSLGLPGNILDLMGRVTGSKTNPFPTTEQISSFGEKVSGGYTAPKGKNEEIAKEYMQDVGSYLPFGGMAGAAGTGGKIIDSARMLQPMLTPLIGMTTKQAAERFGSGEGDKSGWKIASMIAIDLLLNRGKGARGYINHLFSEAEKSISGGGTANVSALRSSLLNLKSSLEAGGSSPAKTAALTKIEEALGQMTDQGGQFFWNVTEFPAFRRSINDIRESLGGWKSEVPPKLKGKAINNLERVKKEIIESGMDYGNKHNPEFAKYWKEANEAANIFSRSQFATRFLESVLSKKLFSKILGGGLAAKVGGSYLAGKPVVADIAQTAIAGGGAALIGAGIYNPVKFMYQASKSPTLRKYFGNLFKSGVERDAATAARYANKIEKELDKEEEKEKNLIKTILKD